MKIKRVTTEQLLKYMIAYPDKIKSGYIKNLLKKRKEGDLK